MFRNLCVQNRLVCNLFMKRSFSFDINKLERIQRLKTKQTLIKSLLDSTDLLDLSALQVGDVILMFRSMHINVNDSVLKSAGVDGEVLSFVESNSDLEELGITLPRAKYAVFAKSMKQFKSKGVPTSFLYDHPDNAPHLLCDDGWKEISCDDDDFHCEASDSKNDTQIVSSLEHGALVPDETESAILTTSKPDNTNLSSDEKEFLLRLSKSIGETNNPNAMEKLLAEIKGPAGCRLSDGAATEACVAVTNFLAKQQNDWRRRFLTTLVGKSSSPLGESHHIKLCLEVIVHLCATQARAVKFCIRDESGACAGVMMDIIAHKKNLENESLAISVSRMLKMLTESGASVRCSDSLAGAILEVLSAQSQNAEIVTACCEAFLAVNKNYQLSYTFLKDISIINALEKVLDVHKGDLRVVGVIVNTTSTVLSSLFAHTQDVLASKIPKLLMDIISLHSDDLDITNKIASFITPLCYNNAGVAIISRYGAVEKLCTVLLKTSTKNNLFDLFNYSTSQFKIEYAINKLCASSPRNRLLVETLLGQERADKIWKI